jgi:hypothetical protein
MVSPSIKTLMVVFEMRSLLGEIVFFLLDIRPNVLTFLIFIL